MAYDYFMTNHTNHIHRCESFDGDMVDHYDPTCTSTTRDDYQDLIILAQAGMIPDEDGI